MAACLFAAGDACKFDSSATAAWLQAIFSVVAILAAAGFPYARSAVRRRQLRREGTAIAHLAYTRICAAWVAVRDPVTFADALKPSINAGLGPALADLQSFPVLELENVAASLAMRAMAVRTESAAMHLQTAVADGDPALAQDALHRLMLGAEKGLRRISQELGTQVPGIRDGEVEKVFPEEWEL